MDIINLALITIIIILIATLIYNGFFSFLGLPGIKKKNNPQGSLIEQKVKKSEEDYRSVIEKSRDEYKSFMEQQRIK